MINNKKNKRKKQKKIPEYRNKKERSEQVKEILKQLCEFDLNTKYEPVQKLYILFKKCFLITFLWVAHALHKIMNSSCASCWAVCGSI